MVSIFLLCLLTGASLQDFRRGRVSNYWILAGLAWYALATLTVFIRSPSFSLSGYIADISCFMLRFFAVIILLFVFFLLRMMGAADIKVMALIGAFLGISEGFRVIFYGLTAAAAWSLFFMLRKKILIKRGWYFISYFNRVMMTGRFCPYYDKERDGAQAGFALVPFLWLGLLIWYLTTGGVG